MLSWFVTIDVSGADNRVDAALAEVTAETLGNSTPAGGYGTPSSQTVPAETNMAVVKFGRTSSQTTGTIIAINATVDVGYSAGTARFVDQVVVIGDAAGFIKAGDSGSLLVTQAGNNPVALLFAGSLGGRIAIGNPIDVVLEELGVQIDGASGETTGNSAANGNARLKPVRGGQR